MKVTARILVAAVLFAASAIHSTVVADDVIEPKGEDKQVYDVLAAEWWNWALQFPVATNPLLDSTGASGHLDQSGSIWFLAGTFGGSATRTLTVPKNTSLFFPIINSVFWAPEDGSTEDDVRELANLNTDMVSIAELSIDGKPAKHLMRKNRFETSAFLLHLPVGGILDEIDAYDPGDRFPAVTDGYWALVRPLRPGNHVIHFRGVAGDPEAPLFETEVKYHITVAN